MLNKRIEIIENDLTTCDFEREETVNEDGTITVIFTCNDSDNPFDGSVHEEIIPGEVEFDPVLDESNGSPNYTPHIAAGVVLIIVIVALVLIRQISFRNRSA